MEMRPLALFAVFAPEASGIAHLLLVFLGVSELLPDEPAEPDDAPAEDEPEQPERRTHTVSVDMMMKISAARGHRDRIA
jgi:hypothetical protein